jgi:hypothetical protein
MTKYDPTYIARSRRSVFASIHPVWRGIGCFLLILLPILAFAGSKLLVQRNFQQRWIDLPRELELWFVIPVLGRVFVADIALTILLLVIIFGIATVIYALLYRLLGPPRPGPLDSPPG